MTPKARNKLKYTIESKNVDPEDTLQESKDHVTTEQTHESNTKEAQIKERMSPRETPEDP